MDSDNVSKLWSKSSDDSEGMRLGYTTQQHYFAALIEQSLIADGWRSPEQVKKAVEDEREACAIVASNHECGGEDDIVCQHQNCGSCIAGGIRERNANE